MGFTIDDLGLVEIIKSICVVAIWVLVAWPLWSIVITVQEFEPLDYLTFMVNAWALCGISYESKQMDWRAWAICLASCFPLSIASSYERYGEFRYYPVIIAGILLGVSLIGSIPGARVSWRVTENFDRRVTGMKILGIVCALGLYIFLLAYLGNYVVRDLVAHFLVGGVCLCALLISLAFVKREKVVGVGSPLLWISLRILLTPNIPRFWAWIIFFVLSFWLINLLRKRSTTIGMAKIHWHGWQDTGAANAFLMLNLAISILILVSHGNSVRTCVSIPENAQRYLTMVSQIKAYEPNMTAISLWALLGYDNFQYNLAPEFTVTKCSEHRMYESGAAMLAVILLVICSVGYVVRSIKDPRSKQGHWLPIFFFAVSIVIWMYPRSPDASLGFLTKRLTTHWHDDAIMAASMCIFGGISGILISAFKRVDGMVLRDRTPHMKVQEEKDSLWAAFGIILLMGTCIMASVAAAIPPEGSRYLNLTKPLVELQTIENSSFIVDLAVSSFSERETELLYFLTNCTSIQCAIGKSALRADNSIQDLSDAAVRQQYQALSSPWVVWDVLVSVTVLMVYEIIAIAVIEVITLALTIGAVRYRLLDDILVVGNFLGAAIFIFAVPQRVHEFRELLPGSVVEWQFITLGVIQLICGIFVVGLRIESPDFIELVWKSKKELDECFAASEHNSLAEFVFNNTGFVVKEDPETAFEEYKKLVDTENGRRANESLQGKAAVMALITEQRKQREEEKAASGRDGETSQGPESRISLEG